MEYRFRRPIYPGRGSIYDIFGANFLLCGGLFKELIHKFNSSFDPVRDVLGFFCWEWFQLSWNQLEIVELLLRAFSSSHVRFGPRNKR